MDNLSHSVVGLALGELVQRSLAPEPDPVRQRQRRRLLLVGAWTASNFPDLDLVLTPLLPSPLGYLLHHRGHTHTLLYALPQALLLVALLWLFWPAARALLQDSARARSGLAIAVSAGFLLHLAMDFLNSYGIHPFHPFDSRWLYGDMVYILEPVFWVAFGVPLAMMLRRPAHTALLLGMLAAALLFFHARGFLDWASLAALTALAAPLAMLQRKAGTKGRQALYAALATALAFVGVQGAAAIHASRLVIAEMHKRDPDAAVADAAMTAFPSNPLCWSFVTVERNDGAGTYRLQRGRLSLAAGLLPVSACPAGFAASAPASSAAAALAVDWRSEGRLDQLRRLKDSNCYFNAWLRFARTPALGARGATDVRFGVAQEGNFSTIRFAPLNGQPCPASVPAWDYPRADLLGPGR